MAQQYFIPKNINLGNQVRGIPYRNIAEGIIIGSALVWAFTRIPFVFNIKLTGSIIIFLLTFIVCCMGVRDESVTQYLTSTFKFLAKKRVLHLRRVGYVSKEERENKAFDEEFEKKEREKKQAKLAKREAKGVASGKPVGRLTGETLSVH